MIGVFVVLPMICRVFWRRSKIANIVSYVLFGLFVAVILVLTTFRVSVDRIVSINYDFSGEWANKQIYFFELFDVKDMLINLCMLCPIGIFVWSEKRGFWANLGVSVLAGLVAGLVIETLQFILPVYRTVQVQDVIFNGISSAIGMFAVYTLNAIYSKAKGGENGKL